VHRLLIKNKDSGALHVAGGLSASAGNFMW